MKSLIAVFAYIISFFLLIVGILSILLEEPWYGLGLILAGFLSLPLISKLLIQTAPKVFAKRNKLLAVSGILLIILISVLSFGRKEYDNIEKITTEELSALSIHPIKQTKINGLDYYYIEKGEGECILLLHGFPDLANTWDETISELSKTNRVIAPFLRGYYPTGIPVEDDYSVKTIAEDMLGLLDNLAIDKFSLVGQDWGASIGFSITNLASNRVRNFVSIAIPHPSCLALTPKMAYAGRHFFLLGSGDYGVRYTRKNNFEYIDRLYQRWSPDYLDWETSSEAIKETFRFPNRTEAATAYYRSFAKDQSDPLIQKFYQQIPTIPVLFLVGENDLIYTDAVVSAMKTKMPIGSEVKVFENAGHFLHREVFPAYIKAVKQFLKKSHSQ